MNPAASAICVTRLCISSRSKGVIKLIPNSLSVSLVNSSEICSRRSISRTSSFLFSPPDECKRADKAVEIDIRFKESFSKSGKNFLSFGVK